MSRLAFMAGFKGQDPGETPADAAKENLIGYFTCDLRVAQFLGIEALAAKSVKRARAEYTKSVLVNGVATEKTVAAGEVDFAASSKAKSRKIILKTGMVTPKKNNRTLTVTFPSNMTINQIGEALAEIIPAGKVQTAGGTKPSASEIYPQFSVKGGRTYPLMTAAAAIASTDVEVPLTDAEKQALANKAK